MQYLHHFSSLLLVWAGEVEFSVRIILYLLHLLSPPLLLLSYLPQGGYDADILGYCLWECRVCSALAQSGD